MLKNQLSKQKEKNENVKNARDPKTQRLRFVLLHVLLFLACVIVSVGIWLTVHYLEYLNGETPETREHESVCFSVLDGSAHDRNA